MPAYAIIGGQWGDEGKGKIVDYLSASADLVVRFSGGNNAGHTVINTQGEFKFHLIPCGVFWPQVTCVIGNGVVVDPDVFLEEIQLLEAEGIDTSRVKLSDKAHLVMPYHTLLDQLEEKARGTESIGTTGKGIGPAYVDKVARSGIRVYHLLDQKGLREKLESTIAKKNELITKLYQAPALNAEEIIAKCEDWSIKISKYIQPAEMIVRESLSDGKKVVLEGAQGALLDIDHGTYPYVTSSSPSIGGACTGLGLPPAAIQNVIGIFKAYSTRVGSGPLPTEMDESTATKLREIAGEYGATTGRPRRCGWFDGGAAKYSATVNGFTSLVLTRLDVLDGFPSIKICTGYKLNNKIIDYFPSSAEELAQCDVVYEELPGWTDPTASARNMKQLPEEAVRYITRLQDIVGVPIDLISTGPKRDEVISIRKIIR